MCFQETSKPQPCELNGTDPFRYVLLRTTTPLTQDRHRTALEASADHYLASHFPDGTTSVFSSPADPAVFIVQIIANRYNPSNFWYVIWMHHPVESYFTWHSRSGRWRSEYEINLGLRLVQGKIAVNVHYYEQGNVSHTAIFDIPLAKQIHLRSN